ncbi:MAG TPA: hypothetical protein VN541_03930 [Tepidisphaeraceae bacterium]|nr:hypothetical protein [Tepidisphaeraceae bacterium]
MPDTVLRTIVDATGKRRVLILQRANGTFGFEVEHRGDNPMERGWIRDGQHPLSVCGSAEVALREATGRVEWLAGALDLVLETAIDYDEVFRRGGRNLGDEDFALFKCPSCARVYLIDYEVDTIYLDADDLSRRTDASPGSFACVACGYTFRADEPIIGPKADRKFTVTWADLARTVRWSISGVCLLIGD